MAMRLIRLRRNESTKSSDGFSGRYDDTYSHRPRSEHGASTSMRASRTHYSSSPEHQRALSDYGGTRRESRYSTMRSDATGDWQYFGPNEVPVQRQSLKRDSPVRSSYSDYYGPPVDSRKMYRSSQSDYNAPTSRRPKPALSDYGGSTHSLKIVRKSSTPKNGYMSSSDESYQDPYPARSMSMPRKPNKNSLVKKTVRRTFKRRDSSPQRTDVQRISVQGPQSPERISVFMNDETDSSPPGRSRTLPSSRERSLSLGRDRAPGKVHTIQTLTRENSTNHQSLPASHSLDRRISAHSTSQQPLQVATMTRKEVLTTQPQPPITSGHTTLTFSGHSVPSKEETYVNKVFQESDQPLKAAETFKSGVIQVEKLQEPAPTPIYKEPPPSSDLHKTRINFLTSELPAVQHHSKIDLLPLEPQVTSRVQTADIREPETTSRVPEVVYRGQKVVSKEPEPVSRAPEVSTYTVTTKPVEYITIRPQVHEGPETKSTKPKQRQLKGENLPLTSYMYLPPVELPREDAVSPKETMKPQKNVTEPQIEEWRKPSQDGKQAPTDKQKYVVLLRKHNDSRIVPVDERKPTRDEPDIGKPHGKPKEHPPPVERVEEMTIHQTADPGDSSEDEMSSRTTRKTTQKVIHMQPKHLKSNEEVEEITETTIHGFYADMPPDRQKTLSELTKTALGRTEQTTGNFFSNGDSKSLITEAWHTNRPKTEQEIIDEITSKTTSEVVKRSILDGVDYKYIPTHSKELEEIQRKRKEFEAEMERQRKIREIKAGIRQNIHVDHNEEDLVGDYSMSVTDDGQIDLDTIEEHVDLGISASGIAAIAVKVTAERILPVDVDQNLWRKSSVTVTRTIEIDLMRCDETRLLYDRILRAHKAALNSRAEEAARQGYPPQQRLAHELDATDTYKIFSALMNVTGEADNEELGILSDVSAKHFLTGDYVKDPKEKEQKFRSAKPSHSDYHEEQVISQSTKGNLSANMGDGRVETQSLHSINPEKIRSTRSSEYYKRKMRDSPPPPEFGTSMFDGDTLADKFDEHSSKRDHTDSFSRQRSLSPVGQMTAHQREYYERSRDSGSARSRQPVYRQEVKIDRRNLSPPAYTERVSKQEYREVHSSKDGDHRTSRHDSAPPGSPESDEKRAPQVLFSERVSGVKQRANEMRRNSELGTSRESLSHSPTSQHAGGSHQRDFNANINNNNDSDMQTRINRRKVYSRDKLLFGGGRDDGSMTEDELVTRHAAHQNKENYESGYYSDVSKQPPNADINRMLNDAERYFKKTATERELTRSEGGYYSPRYNNQSTRHHSGHSDYDEPQQYRHEESYEVDDGMGYTRQERSIRSKRQPENEGTYYERDVRHVRHGDGQTEKSELHYSKDVGRRVQYRDDGHPHRHGEVRVDVVSPHNQGYSRHDEGIFSSPDEEEREHAWSSGGHSQAGVGSREHLVTSEEVSDQRQDFQHQIPADNYMSVKTRRSQIRKQMNEMDMNSEEALADQRRAMLGGNRYVPSGSRSQVVTTRRSSNSRRW